VFAKYLVPVETAIRSVLDFFRRRPSAVVGSAIAAVLAVGAVFLIGAGFIAWLGIYAQARREHGSKSVADGPQPEEAK
jgi:hypothetical protein